MLAPGEYNIFFLFIISKGGNLKTELKNINGFEKTIDRSFLMN